MKENTPIQQAIQYWTERREEAPTIQMEQAADLFLQYLNASLPAEKEFVGRVWNAGFRKGWQEGENRDEPYDDPALSKPEFINQLYPEK